MDVTPNRQARIAQTTLELTRLQENVAAELKIRCDRDEERQQYYSQLTALEQVLNDSLGVLREKLQALANQNDLGTVYAECRRYDLHLLLLRRVLNYYLEKYDQRLHVNYGPVLRAADEIIWSCYADVFRNVSNIAEATDSPTAAAARRGTVPLPYIEIEYSPEAIPRTKPGQDLRPIANDQLLAAYLQQLPIPVIGLPPMCVTEPWWLIYLGHEVGHHLQYDLVPAPDAMQNPRLLSEFRQLLQAQTGQGSPRWREYHQEIFADVCSVYAMGPWAVRGLVELVLTNDKNMVLSKEGDTYPSPAIRLALLAELVTRLGLDPKEALGPVDLKRILGDSAPEGEDGPQGGGVPAAVDVNQARAKQDNKLVAGVVAAIEKAELGGIGTFADLYGWNKNDFTERGADDAGAGPGDGPTVSSWKRALFGHVVVTPAGDRRRARLIASAGVAAWTELISMPAGEARDRAWNTVRANFLRLIEESREPGTRAASATSAWSVDGRGAQVTEALLQELQRLEEV